MIHATVDSVIRLREGDVPPKMLGLLHHALSFPNPEFKQRQWAGRWTGDVPEELSLLGRDPGGDWVIPRGAVNALRDAALQVDETLSFEDRRVSFEPEPYAFSFTLRGYQEEAVAVLARHTQGVTVQVCGSGKTVVGVGVIARLGQPALILVHTHDLLEQWRDTIRAALGLEAGMIGAGEARLERVTVATVQTLAALERETLELIGRRFGVVLVDEAHHVPAETFRQVLSHLPSKYRFGLTATPEREDGLTPLLTLGLGPTLFQLDHQPLIDAGFLVVPEIYVVNTDISVEAEEHAALINALCDHPRRNEQILALAREAVFEGRALLILSGRVTHCEQLAAALNEEGINAAALTSQVPKRRRVALLDLFRAGELAVLCATSLADEGLDVSRLERLILATPARAEGRTIQRLGRLMRPHPGKDTPILYDLVDAHPMALRQHAARRRAYRKALGSVAIRSYA